MDFPFPFLAGGKGLPWESISGRFPCDTAPLASGSALVALEPLSLPLVRPEGQPAIPQLSSSETGEPAQQQRALC